MSASRSPRYPAISLAEGLRLANMIYNKERNTPLTTDDACRAIGYSSASGPARVKLSALRKYGILQNQAGKLRLSSLALKMLFGVGEEKQRAIRDAAMNVELFQEIRTKLPDASDDVLSSYLICELEFTKEGAQKVIEAYRESLEITGWVPTAIVGGFSDDDNGATAREILVGDKSRNDAGELNVQHEQFDVLHAPATVLTSHTEVLSNSNEVREETTLDSGRVVLIWPKQLDKESVLDFEYWMNGLIQRAKRRAGL